MKRAYISTLRMVARKFVLGVYRNLFEVNCYQPTFEKTICCSKEDIEFLTNYSNVIIHVNNGSEIGFFHECRCHCKFNKYMAKLIDDYFKYVYNGNNSDEFRSIIEVTLKNSYNRFAFVNMGALHSSNSNVAKYNLKKADSSIIGFDGRYPEWFDDDFRKFVRYIWSPIEDYNNNCFLRGYESLQLFNAKKAVLTKIIADAIGIHYIVPKTQYVILDIAGDKKYGVLTSPAKGVDPSRATFDGIDPNFQKELLELHLLDTVCYQLDHRPGNYFVSQSAGSKAFGVSAFDNDCTTGFKAKSTIEENDYMGCSALVKDGKINVTFLPRDVVERMKVLDWSEMHLDEYLSPLQIRALLIRVKSLVEVINTSLKSHECELLDECDWCEKTVEVELRNSSMSYLKLFKRMYLEK